MNEDIMAGLANFDEVWSRVGSPMPEYAVGASCPLPAAGAGEDEKARLERFMQGEAADGDLYGRLAKCVSGKARELLMRAASDEKRHLKKLQLEYFLLTGNSYAANFSPNPVNGVLTALRNAYLDEKAGAAEYRAASANVEGAELRELYALLAEDEARHAEYMRHILACTM